MDKIRRRGQATEPRRVGAEWLGWQGRVAHPDAPIGGGGPGFFAPADGLPDSGSPAGLNRAGLHDPSRPGPLNGNNDETVPLDTPKPPNPPPATAVSSLGSLRKVQSDHVDVDIEGEVLADGTGGPSNGAHTEFSIPKAKAPAYESANGKITKFAGKLTWKGKITIQTLYGTGATASSLSCYGRGTTAEDVKNRDITLGFHESCHRQDFLDYLKNNPLPEPPEIKLGMEATEYDTAVNQFVADIKNYKVQLDQASDAVTDAVGHPLSDVASKGCYVHSLP